MKASIWIIGVVAVLLTLFVAAATACDEVKAWTDDSCLTPLLNNYLEIGDSESMSGHTCNGETFNTRYSAVLSTSCGGSTSCSITIEANGLSEGETYKVTAVNGNCIELCECQ